MTLRRFFILVDIIAFFLFCVLRLLFNLSGLNTIYVILRGVYMILMNILGDELSHHEIPAWIPLSAIIWEGIAGFRFPLPIIGVHLWIRGEIPSIVRRRVIFVLSVMATLIGILYHL